MTVINGHYDGKSIVLDEPMPAGIPANARVRVVVESPHRSRALAEIAKLAVAVPDLPRDYAANHDKYLYGKQGR